VISIVKINHIHSPNNGIKLRIRLKHKLKIRPRFSINIKWISCRSSNFKFTYQSNAKTKPILSRPSANYHKKSKTNSWTMLLPPKPSFTTS